MGVLMRLRIAQENIRKSIVDAIKCMVSCVDAYDSKYAKDFMGKVNIELSSYAIALSVCDTLAKLDSSDEKTQVFKLNDYFRSLDSAKSIKDISEENYNFYFCVKTTLKQNERFNLHPKNCSKNINYAYWVETEDGVIIAYFGIE